MPSERPTIEQVRALAAQASEGYSDFMCCRCLEINCEEEQLLRDAMRDYLRLREQEARRAQSTHSEACWQWHQDCAVAEVERLRASQPRYRVGDRVWVTGMRTIHTGTIRNINISARGTTYTVEDDDQLGPIHCTEREAHPDRASAEAAVKGGE